MTADLDVMACRLCHSHTEPEAGGYLLSDSGSTPEMQVMQWTCKPCLTTLGASPKRMLDDGIWEFVL